MTSNAWLVFLGVIVLLGWIGHACLFVAALNFIYGCPLPKWFLRPYRLVTGLVILAFPLLLFSAFDFGFARDEWEPLNGAWGTIVCGYLAICLLFGGVIFPFITLKRLLRPMPTALLAERSETVDLWKELGAAAVGNGKHQWAVRFPFTCAFQVDFTELELSVEKLPPEWDGLTILLLSDLHFHGTPGLAYFEKVIDRLVSQPPPDLVILAGDYLDTDTHHEWIVPLLSRLKGTEASLAILGNHDEHHQPDRVRNELVAAGYTVLSNTSRACSIRGVEAVVIGHEGPWFTPPPDPDTAPDPFRVCISHTPDNFYWGQRHRIGLMMCGHVHGGQIRLPIIGSIFIPSIYGRRFDQGIFEQNGTLMVVGRGLSGKEPLRFRCRPQTLRLTLRCRVGSVPERK